MTNISTQFRSPTVNRLNMPAEGKYIVLEKWPHTHKSPVGVVPHDFFCPEHITKPDISARLLELLFFKPNTVGCQQLATVRSRLAYLTQTAVTCSINGFLTANKIAGAYFKQQAKHRLPDDRDRKQMTTDDDERDVMPSPMLRRFWW